MTKRRPQYLKVQDGLDRGGMMGPPEDLQIVTGWFGKRSSMLGKNGLTWRKATRAGFERVRGSWLVARGAVQRRPFRAKPRG